MHLWKHAEKWDAPPVATTMTSPIDDLSDRSMVTTSSAFISFMLARMKPSTLLSRKI